MHLWNPIWIIAHRSGQQHPKKLRESLCVAQRSALRAILDYDKTIRSKDLFRILSVQPTEQRWTTQDASWLFRIIKREKSLPVYLKNLICFKECPYKLRSKTIDAARKTVLGESMLLWRFRDLHARIPVSFWECSNVEIFKQNFASKFF